MVRPFLAKQSHGIDMQSGVKRFATVFLICMAFLAASAYTAINGGLLPTPTQVIAPKGSLIHRSSLDGTFDSVGEADSVSIDLDAGQTVSIRFIPQDSAVSARVTLLDSSDTTLATSSASAPGDTIILQSIPVVSEGTYTVRTSSIEGVGPYQLDVVLNSALETEANGGASNDAIDTAQDLNQAVVSLTQGGTRLAVLGEINQDTDYFSFDLTGAQTATVMLTPLDEVTLELAVWDTARNKLQGSYDRRSDGTVFISDLVA